MILLRLHYFKATILNYGSNLPARFFSNWDLRAKGENYEG